MSGWTLRPPTTPGQYEYRELPTVPTKTFEVVDVDGEMMAELPGMWMYLAGLDGEWQRVLSERQRDKLELKGRA